MTRGPKLLEKQETELAEVKKKSPSLPWFRRVPDISRGDRAGHHLIHSSSLALLWLLLILRPGSIDRERAMLRCGRPWRAGDPRRGLYVMMRKITLVGDGKRR